MFYQITFVSLQIIVRKDFKETQINCEIKLPADITVYLTDKCFRSTIIFSLDIKYKRKHTKARNAPLIVHFPNGYAMISTRPIPFFPFIFIVRIIFTG